MPAQQKVVLFDRLINLFLALPVAALDRLALKKDLDRIGRD